MNTRKNFMEWVRLLEYTNPKYTDSTRFYNIGEKEYVFELITHIKDVFPAREEYCSDFENLEIFRYSFIENFIPDQHKVHNEIKKAIAFCAKSDEEKRKCRFLINEELKNQIVQSDFLWDALQKEGPHKQKSHYAIIPSFLEIAPKEICLTDLKSLLLDLKDFDEVFSYDQIFDLLAKQLSMDSGTLDAMLLEFISVQALYYQTFLIVQ